MKYGNSHWYSIAQDGLVELHQVLEALINLSSLRQGIQSIIRGIHTFAGTRLFDGIILEGSRFAGLLPEAVTIRTASPVVMSGCWEIYGLTEGSKDSSEILGDKVRLAHLDSLFALSM